MSKTVINEMKEKMDRTIQHYKNELKGVRTGRASVSLFDNIRVQVYGAPTPLNGVGTLHVADAHMVTVQPWDTSLISAIEKAILSSGLGFNPSNDGKLIRIPIPKLTEERRKEMVKLIKKMAEETKVALRNERRDANEKIKKLEKDKDNPISEDESKRALDEVQKLTDAQIKNIDDISVAKEKELMEI
ncbi:MAG: ribosome recycling factor [Deferribacteraceae bacterium]|jgi:ribosome recycling factor|nr:ribosome recycling factor [Deferribacteraceae bacterium]